jgi:hypothetical protein
VGLAPEWPWGAAVDPFTPFYLSPDPEPLAHSRRTGLRERLLVVPLLVSVAINDPKGVRPPFDVHIVATGPALAGDTVTLNVPFADDSRERKLNSSKGKVLTKRWLGVFPVVSRRSSFQIQATIVASTDGSPASSGAARVAQSDGSALTVRADFPEAPSATSLPPSDQTALVGSLARQSVDGFDVKSIFEAVTTAASQVQAKLSQVRGTSEISIGDMFEMQMLMNHLSQLSEMSTSVISAINEAIASQARNVKG